jgi:3-hydroxyisobutyrate dehydrogenase-like beta-hydroxyacid dehydrogenase
VLIEKRVKICRMIESIQNIGVVGLGRMGTATANNILKSGFNLVVYNRTPDNTRSLIEVGATTATSPKQAAIRSDVVVTSLTDDRAVLDLVTGEEGILSGLRPDTIHIGTSTISPSVSTQLGEMHSARGCLYLAAPVLGNPSVAQAAKLTTFVAGDPTAIKRCNQLFHAYCQKIIDVGKEHAMANRLKLTANYILLVLIDLMGQVFTVGEKSNIDLQVMSQVMEIIFSSPALQEYARRIRTKDFDNVGYSLPLAFKDVQLILESSANVHVPLPYASSLRDKFLAAIANKLDKDCISIYEITRMLAGLKSSG